MSTRSDEGTVFLWGRISRTRELTTIDTFGGKTCRFKNNDVSIGYDEDGEYLIVPRRLLPPNV